jgi:hypothetical protein
VANPLKMKFTLDPCRTLTETQQKNFGVVRSEVTGIAKVDGSDCFFYLRPRGTIAVVVAYNDTNGLSMRYAEHVHGAWTYWEPATVDGYPGVAYGSKEPNGQGTCNFAIGITDDLFFWATADDKAGSPRCSAAKEVATAVLTTVRANQ